MEQQSKEKFLQLSPLSLAFIGDSVHTLFVREHNLGKFQTLGKLSSNSAKLCKASTQAQALKRILPLLSDEEKEIVRKARNCKPKHSAKNASSADYCYATAFEALIGYIYLFGNRARLQELLQLSCKSEENYAD